MSPKVHRPQNETLFDGNESFLRFPTFFETLRLLSDKMIQRRLAEKWTRRPKESESNF
jgi:hypothetical protein